MKKQGRGEKKLRATVGSAAMDGWKMRTADDGRTIDGRGG